MRETAAHTVRRAALVVSQGVQESGRAEVIGIRVGQVASEGLARAPARPGGPRPVRVRRLISDAHPGPKKAIARVIGAAW